MPFWPFKKRDEPAPPPPPGTVAGLVHRAADATLLGRSTALLDAGGRSFLAAAVGTLVGGGCRPVTLVLAEGQEDERRKAEAAGAAVLPDPGRGPPAALELALRALEGRAEGVAVLPVDHPLVRAETVQRLLEAFRESGAPAVVPVHGGERGHPRLFRHTLFGELLDLEAEGGLGALLDARTDEVLRVEVDDPGVVAGIDTPEAYRAAFPGSARP